MASIEWSTNYPAGIDTLTEQPTLVNDNDDTRVSQIHAMRDAVQAIESEVGTNPGDTPASSLRKRVTDIEAGVAGIDTTAIHEDVAGEINAIAAKATPVAADVIVIEDSADSFNKKSATLTTLLAGGSGFASREEEFTAVAGTQTFTLAATAAVNANMLSGRTILNVERNGVGSRWQATATLANEWDLPAGNQVRVVAQTGGEIFRIVYGT